MPSSARRTALALASSLLAHVALAGAMTGVAIFQALDARVPIELELGALAKEAPKDLPLGPMPVSEPPAAKARPQRRQKVVAVATGTPGTQATAPDADPEAQPADAGLARTDALPDADESPSGPAPIAGRRENELQALGPPGARLSAILRLDRLREPGAAVYVPLIERLLTRMPDRRRLLSGGELDLYRDFDSLLIATPNPMDDAVTFLAVRHHLEDEHLMRELSRAAQDARQPITWQEIRGRPVGLRARMGRDERIVVLPAAGLAIVAAPAYAELLLGTEAKVDRAPGDAGATPPADFATLAARLSAESELLPEGVVFMLTTANLFSAQKARALAASEPTAAATGDLAMPDTLTLYVSAVPWVVAEARAEFPDEKSAAGWARELPELRRKLLGNPLTTLSGLSPVVAALEVAHEGNVVTARTKATRAQVEALFALVLNLSQGR